MNKKQLEEQKLILKRYLTLDQLKLVVPIIKYCEYAIDKIKRLDTELAHIRNTELIDNYVEPEVQVQVKQESVIKRRHDWVRAMKAQGLKGTKDYILILKQMGISEQEAENI